MNRTQWTQRSVPLLALRWIIFFAIIAGLASSWTTVSAQEEQAATPVAGQMLDADSDGTADDTDNCVDTSNADQLDTDGDGTGDVCDDSDGDGIFDDQDSTPTGDTDGDGIDNATDPTPNGDTDGDGIDNLADPTPNGDDDADGVDNTSDNCPADANADQGDGDQDGAGDACDPLSTPTPNATAPATDSPGKDGQEPSEVANQEERAPSTPTLGTEDEAEADGGQPQASPDDAADDVVALASPTADAAITLTVSCRPKAAAGTRILSEGFLLYTGDAALSGVTVVHDVGTPLDPSDDVTATILSGDDGDGLLEPNESWHHITSFLVGAEDLIDTLTVTGTGDDGAVATVTATCATEVLDGVPLAMSARCPSEVFRPGQGIAIGTSVITAGGGAIRDVSVVDDAGTPGDFSDDVILNHHGGDDGDGLLERGEQWVFSNTHVLGDEDQEATLTATGIDENGASVFATATCQIDVHATPTITTQARNAADDSVIRRLGIVTVGTAVYDTATLLGATANPGGTIRYELHTGMFCGGTPIFTVELNLADGNVPPSTAVILDEPGIYNWYVEYSGDANNEPVTNRCSWNTMVAGEPSLNLDLACPSRAEPGSTILLSARVGNSIGEKLFNTVVFFDPGTPEDDSDDVGLRRISGDNGDWLLDPSETWLYQTELQVGTEDLAVTVTAKSAREGGILVFARGICEVEVNHLPTLRTQPRDAATDSPIDDDAEVPIGTTVYDTAILSGGLDLKEGTVTYTLYASADCSGPPVYTDAVELENGRVPQSGSITLAKPGTYNWQAVYSGDDNNEPASSECGTETVEVLKHATSITTQPRNAANDAAIADDTVVAPDTSVYDTAVFNGGLDVKTGTLTYSLHAGTACTGTALYTDMVELGTGTVPPSGSFTLAQPGIYNWQAAYAGDDSHATALSECGLETIIVLSPNPAIAVEVACPAKVDAEGSIEVIARVMNIGDTPLEAVHLRDNLSPVRAAAQSAALVLSEGDDGDDLLELGEAWVYRGSYRAGAEDHLITVTASARDEFEYAVDATSTCATEVLIPSDEPVAPKEPDANPTPTATSSDSAESDDEVVVIQLPDTGGGSAAVGNGKFDWQYPAAGLLMLLGVTYALRVRRRAYKR